MKLVLLIAILAIVIVDVWGRQDDIDVRLVNGTSLLEGRVEVYAFGSWKTVCSGDYAYWDMNDATVVCRQLGYGIASSAPGSAYFGPGKGKMLRVECTGFEEDLSGCTLTNAYPDRCTHEDDSGVICTGETGGQLRLVGGRTYLEGQVQMNISGVWGTICKDYWSLDDATVVCRQLGYGVASAAVPSAYFGQSTGDLLFIRFYCTGKEKRLIDCPLNYKGEDTCRLARDAGVICTGQNYTGQVRLVNGTNELQGRVEVRLSVNNETQWGTVCGDRWGINDATVVCSQLGYGKAESAYTGQGNGDVALVGVSCAGLENSLLECPRNAYLNCNQLTTAWVTCALPDQYDLRLRFGKTDLEGRVEVYENSTWATVCDNWWGSTEATVACWQLGYGKATAAPRRSFFGQDSGDIVFGTVDCQGTENSLHACQRSSEYCSHFEQVGVVCSQPDVYDIRLINGSHWREGRVEVYVKGHWGTVCDHSWDLRDAIVVCRQLGFKSATAAPGSAYFGQGSGDIVLDKVACDGTESSLQYCPWYGDTFSCLHDQDAGVVCSNADLPEKYDVRLRGGDSDLEGRVEVYIIGAWATVCDHGWDITDATVVCQQLGHTGALSANSSAAFGQGTGNIVFDKVACKGTENRLHDCPLDTTNNCSHSQDAGVVCKPPELYDLRLMSGSNAMEGRVEMYKDDSWETVCDYDWTITDATVACWQLGYTKAISAHKSAYFGQGSGELARTIGWECTGAESTLEDCTMSMYWPPCRHSEDVGVVCGVEEFAEEGSLRLIDGTTQYGGRVEIYLNGRWGTICNNAWQFEEVDVVCKQLGYGHATSFNRDYTEMGTGAILIFSVLCNGKESRLTDCRYRSADPLRCTHIGDAGVTCSAPETLTDSKIGIIIGVPILVVTGLICIILFVRWYRRRPSLDEQDASRGQTTTRTVVAIISLRKEEDT